MSKWTVGEYPLSSASICEHGKFRATADTPEQSARIVRLLNEGEADKLRLDRLESEWLEEDDPPVTLIEGRGFIPNHSGKWKPSTLREAIDASEREPAGRESK